ncbi:MAG: hypothetical protein WAU28_05730 [Candidatus Moraniibacteriota bacterium]
MKQIINAGLVTLAVLLSGCMGPAEIPPIEVVKPNETAFVIPLEGDSASQEKFESVKYLQAKKVQAKRITLPIKKRETGRWLGEFEWLPTVRVIKVDRSLVTREWSEPSLKGKPPTNMQKAAIAVESKESIGFHVGINVTVLIQEDDAATYLYWHNVKSLQNVTDTNIRGFIQGVLSREFGALSLEQAKEQKNRVFGVAEKEAKDHFKQYGITILNLGNAGGLEFDDPEIQAAINNTQTSEMKIDVAKKDKLAQDERNKRDVATAIAARQAAEEFAKAKEAQTARVDLEIKMVYAQAALEAAKKFDGKLPANVLPSNSGMLFGLDRPLPTPSTK